MPFPGRPKQFHTKQQGPRQPVSQWFRNQRAQCPALWSLRPGCFCRKRGKAPDQAVPCGWKAFEGGAGARWSQRGSVFREKFTEKGNLSDPGCSGVSPLTSGSSPWSTFAGRQLVMPWQRGCPRPLLSFGAVSPAGSRCTFAPDRPGFPWPSFLFAVWGIARRPEQTALCARSLR